MDENDWLTTTDVSTMLAFVAGRDAPPGAVVPVTPISERKLRLFLVACCRAHWGLFEEAVLRVAIEVAERFAEGEADEEQRRTAEEAINEQFVRVVSGPTAEAALEVGQGRLRWYAMTRARASLTACASFDELVGSRDSTTLQPPQTYAWAGRGLFEVALMVTQRRVTGGFGPAWDQSMAVENARQAALLRCVAGNPFRVPVVEAAAMTATVRALAEAAYEARMMPSGELDSERVAVLADAVEETGVSAEMVRHLRGPGPHVRGCWTVDLLTGRG